MAAPEISYLATCTKPHHEVWCGAAPRRAPASPARRAGTAPGWGRGGPAAERRVLRSTLSKSYVYRRLTRVLTSDLWSLLAKSNVWLYKLQVTTMGSAARYIVDLAARGRHHFTTEEAAARQRTYESLHERAMGGPSAAQNRLARNKITVRGTRRARRRGAAATTCEGGFRGVANTHLAMCECPP